MPSYWARKDQIKLDAKSQSALKFLEAKTFDSECKMEQLDKGDQPTIETSVHAARGLFTCTNQGLIVARGFTHGLTHVQRFDTVYCHEDDEEEVRRILLDSQEHSGKLPQASP
jgi:hypothetical protein